MTASTDALPLLALDTATRRATVALCHCQQVLAENDREVTTHSEGLLRTIDETLRAAGLELGQLGGVVCGLGPGSFTGLRIGLATAKGLCLASGRPLLGVSSLLALCRGAEPLARPDELVAAVLDARRGELFWRLHRGGTRQGAEQVGPPEALLQALAPAGQVLLCGDGALAYAEQLLARLGPRARLAPRAAHLLQARYLAWEGAARLAAGQTDQLDALAPRYLRPSDAKLPATPQDRRPPLGGDRTPGARATDAPAPARDGAAAAAPAGELPAAALPAAAPPDPALPDPEPPDPEWLERLRQSGLRLDREGRWWHEGELVRHPRLGQVLHRWLDRLADGRYVVRLDQQRYAYVEVEDAPVQLTRLRIEGEGPGARLWATLSDESEEELDYASLVQGAQGALYCRVKAGRMEARLSRTAQLSLGQLVHEEPAGGFSLAAAGRRWAIGERRGR